MGPEWFRFGIFLLLCAGSLHAIADHSPQIGWSFDGYPIFGPYTDGGVLPTDLDACNGRTHPTYGYIYHATPEAPYIIGCYRAAPLCETTNNVNGCIQTSAATISTSVTAVSTCGGSSDNMKLQSGGNPDLYQWTLQTGNIPTFHLCTKACCNTTMAGYSWTATGGKLGITSSVSCTQTSSVVTVSSNGIPNHAVGVFPMTLASTGKNIDNPNSISASNYNWKIPRVPQAKLQVPASIISDVNALPFGPIGFALNGVPFFNPYNVQKLDAVNPCSDGFEVMDYCGGHPQERGGYHYHAIPWCTFADTAKNEETSRLAHKYNCYRNMEGSTCIDLIDAKGNLLNNSASVSGSGSGSSSDSGADGGNCTHHCGGSDKHMLIYTLGIGLPVLAVIVIGALIFIKCRKKNRRIDSPK